MKGEFEKIDILHVHYAIPHAASAYLARQMLKERAPKVITTLHGTDITLVGNDRSYLPITRFTIMESDGVAVFGFLKRATYDKLNVFTRCEIEVIYNFVDTDEYSPTHACSAKFRKMTGCQSTDLFPMLCHVSNFRPVSVLMMS